MRPPLANRNPGISYRNEFIACSLSHGPTAILILFSAHGAVVLSRMIRTALLLIFGGLWKPTIAEHSPTSSLPSPIGRRRGNFLDRSVMFLLQMPMHKVIYGKKLTER